MFMDDVMSKVRLYIRKFEFHKQN